MGEIYWGKNIVSDDIMQGDMVFEGVYGEELEDSYKGLVNYSLSRIRVGNFIVYSKNGNDLYKMLHPSVDVSTAISKIKNMLDPDDDINGVVIEDNLESFVEWKDKKRWIQNFTLQFNKTFYDIKGKQPTIYSTAMDMDSVKGLLNTVNGILVLPLNGLLYGNNRFLLPGNGYLRLEDENYRDSYRRTFHELSELLHIKQLPDETYLDFVTRMQVHVFNFEIKRMTWDYDVDGEFKYGEERIDSDKLYDLALVRGMQDNKPMKRVIEEMRQGINKAMVEGDSTEMMSSMARIYSILLSRIEVGTGLDESNGELSSVVSKDIKNALHYGLKIQERIQDIEESKHKRSIDEENLRIKKEELRLKGGGSIYDGENVEVTKLNELEERLNNENQESD